MIVSKKSDGIRKKSGARIMSDDMMRDHTPSIAQDRTESSEPRIIPSKITSDEPRERVTRHASTPPAQTMRDTPPNDDAPEPESDFLASWRSSEDIGAEPPVTQRARHFQLAHWGMIAGAITVAGTTLFISTRGAFLTVEFKPRLDEITLQDIAVAFDTSAAKVLKPKKVIPAEMLSFPRRNERTFTATGKRQIADRARGKTAIINSFSSSPQTLVAGTRFLTDAGLLFRLQKAVIVPGAKIEKGKIVPQSVNAELIADSPGDSFNIAGPVYLKIPGFHGTPKYEGFSAIAEQGFTGGIQGEAAVVSADDLKAAQEQVTKTLFDELKEEIRRKIPPGFTALKELQSIEIIKITAPAAGARTEQFSTSADAVGKIIVFREEDAITLITALTLTDADGKELVKDSVALQYHTRSIDFSKGRADMTITGTVKTKAVVREDELAALVAGKKDGSVADVLRGRAEISSFNLSIFPPWRSTAPRDPSRIRFTIQGQ